MTHNAFDGFDACSGVVEGICIKNRNELKGGNQLMIMYRLFAVVEMRKVQVPIYQQFEADRERVLSDRNTEAKI